MLDKSQLYSGMFPSGCIVFDNKSGYYLSLQKSGEFPRSLLATVIATDSTTRNNAGFTYRISGARLVANMEQYHPINFEYLRESKECVVDIVMTPLSKGHANFFSMKGVLSRIFNSEQKFIYSGRIWETTSIDQTQGILSARLIGDAGKSFLSRMRFFMSARYITVDLVTLAQEAIFCKNGN